MCPVVNTKMKNIEENVTNKEIYKTTDILKIILQAEEEIRQANVISQVEMFDCLENKLFGQAVRSN